MDLIPNSLLLFLSLLSLYLYVFHLRPRKSPNHGFTLYPIVGTLPEFLLNRHRFLDWTAGILAGCPSNTAVFRRPGKVHGVITANPLVVEHMLKSHFENYPKGDRFRTLLQDFLGTGIFNADGDVWRTQRKTASYEFNTKSLRHFAMKSVTLELQTRLLPILGAAAGDGRVLDFQDLLERFAFDNICRVAFGVDPGCLGGDATSRSEFMEAFEEAATLSSGRFMYAFPKLYAIKKFLNLGSENRLQKSISIVHQFAVNIIKSRLEEGLELKSDEDLLSRFIAQNQNSAQHLNLRDIVISFILAGRDTTSSALSWFFWLLSLNPHVEKKIAQEIQMIRKQKTLESSLYTYNYDELREMHYLHAAISEAMRLYPPVPVDTKNCKVDDVLPDGTFIGKDWFMSYCAYAMGRMESIWGTDCCEYKPERWMENGVCRQVSWFMYPVFHAGPRMCLGKDMAYIQMKSIAASILERFELQVMLEKGKCPQHVLSLTLRMKGGLPVTLKDRKYSS